MNRIIISVALALSALACLGQTPENSPTGGQSNGSHSDVTGHPDLTLVRERDATGDWVTVVDRDGTELCMFSTEPGESLDYAHIADVCEFNSVASK